MKENSVENANLHRVKQLDNLKILIGKYNDILQRHIEYVVRNMNVVLSN